MEKKIIKNIPIWMMRQAGRYLHEYRIVRNKFKNFFDMCYDTEAVVNITLQPIKKFDFDAAIVFTDILVILDFLGFEITFEEGVGPVVNSNIEYNKEIYIPGLDINQEKALSILNAIKIIRKELDSEKSFIGFSGGPWTIASYMIEGSGSKDYFKARKFFASNSEFATNLINRLTDAITKFLLKQIDYGVDVIQIFDSNALFLNTLQFHEFVSKPTKKIVDCIRKIHPNFPIIGFPNGAGLLYENYSNFTKISAVSVDQIVPIDMALKNIHHSVVQGNIDPFFLAYDVDGAINYAKSIIDILDNRGFIMNLGRGVLPETPECNVQRFITEVREYYCKIV